MVLKSAYRINFPPNRCSCACMGGDGQEALDIQHSHSPHLLLYHFGNLAVGGDGLSHCKSSPARLLR